MQDPAPEVFFRGTLFRGTYSFGKRQLAFGLFAITLGTLLLALKYLNGRMTITRIEWSWETLARVSYYSFIIGVSAWSGSKMVYHACKKTKCGIVVDQLGCLDETCAKKPFLPWSEIRVIGLTEYYHGGYHFFIQPRGPFWMFRIRILETTPGMTWEQGATVLHAIKREVLPKHPHLKVNP
ncbi:MAG TPA: hypothetical protein VGO11_11335 [Chthoniobacteraceae bacterium]|jgi:hypothetical protein|nr:hypothetical protein [Chthoniobacteraceae bacterium]